MGLISTLEGATILAIMEELAGSLSTTDGEISFGPVTLSMTDGFEAMKPGAFPDGVWAQSIDLGVLSHQDIAFLVRQTEVRAFGESDQVSASFTCAGLLPNTYPAIPTIMWAPVTDTESLITFSSTDFDGDPLVFRYLLVPEGASFPAVDAAAWDLAQVAVSPLSLTGLDPMVMYTIAVLADDQFGGKTLGTLAFSTGGNLAPVAFTPIVSAITPDTAVVTFSTTDQPGDVLTYKLWHFPVDDVPAAWLANDWSSRPDVTSPQTIALVPGTQYHVVGRASDGLTATQGSSEPFWSLPSPDTEAPRMIGCLV